MLSCFFLNLSLEEFHSCGCDLLLDNHIIEEPITRCIQEELAIWA